MSDTTSQMHVLAFSEFGSPSVLKYQTIPRPAVQPGTVLLRTKAIGLNFADIYRRHGHYPVVGERPYVLGYEAAGVVEEVGEGVHDVQVGQRIAFADVPRANAELVLVPIEHVIPLPNDISFEQAASLLLQGLTAQYLTYDSYRIRPGTVALVHAVAGGVGQMLTQFIKAMGGDIIGLTSRDDKREEALQNGADMVILYQNHWEEVVRAKLPADKQIDVVYDAVGTTLRQSLDLVRIGGTVVFFGMAGGDPPAINPRQLMDTSKTITGGDLWDHLTSRAERIGRANTLFNLVRQGKLHANITATYPLAEGSEAHRFLESRRSTGKILLIP